MITNTNHCLFKMHGFEKNDAWENEIMLKKTSFNTNRKQFASFFFAFSHR